MLICLVFPKSASAAIPHVTVHLNNAVTGAGVNGFTFTETNGSGQSRSRTTTNTFGYDGLAFFGGTNSNDTDFEKFGCGDNPMTFTVSQPSSGTITPASQVLSVYNDIPSYDLWYTYNPPRGTIDANPWQVLDGPGDGTSIITWTATNVVGELWVWDTTPGANGSDVPTGQSGSGGTYTAPWIKTDHNYYFTVKDSAHTQNLAQGNVTRPAATGSIFANPEIVADGAGNGETAITWSSSNTSTAEVWVSKDGAAETLFGRAPSATSWTNAIGTGSQPSTGWIVTNSNYVFKLYSGTAHTTTLGNPVTVTRPAARGNISATVVPYNAAGGSTTISWNTTNTNTPQVRVYEAAGTPGALCFPSSQCDLSISGTSGAFNYSIAPGRTYYFSLYKGPCSDGTCSNVSPALGTATVTMSPPPATPPILGALNFSGGSGGRTTGRLSTEQGANWNNPITVTLNASPVGAGVTIKEYYVKLPNNITIIYKNNIPYVNSGGGDVNISGYGTGGPYILPSGIAKVAGVTATNTSAQWQVTFVQSYNSQILNATNTSAYVKDSNALCDGNNNCSLKSISVD